MGIRRSAFIAWLHTSSNYRKKDRNRLPFKNYIQYEMFGPPLAGDICCRAERSATTRWPTTTRIFLRQTCWTTWTLDLLDLKDHQDLLVLLERLVRLERQGRNVRYSSGVNFVKLIEMKIFVLRYH